jgi:hypothetical protein
VVNLPELLAGEAHHGCIDNGLHLVDVIAQYAKEQRLVAVVQRIERDEFVQRVGELAQICQEPLRLFRLTQHMWRQQPAQTQRYAFFFRKGGALVEQRIAQYIQAASRAGTAIRGVNEHGKAPLLSLLLSFEEMTCHPRSALRG